MENGDATDTKQSGHSLNAPREIERQIAYGSDSRVPPPLYTYWGFGSLSHIPTTCRLLFDFFLFKPSRPFSGLRFAHDQI